LLIFRSAEIRAYVTIVGLLAGAAVAWNAADGGFSVGLMRRTVFTTVSLSTTTGYRLLDFDRWADAVQLLIVFAVALGGMAGSAAGGFKVFRLMAMMSYVRRQLFRQLHPRSVAVVRFGNQTVPEVVVVRVVGFFGLFMATGAVATFLVAAFGADMRTAISAVTSAIGNTGPGLGAAGPMRSFVDLPSDIRDVLMAVTILGRLEIFPVLLGVVPLFRFVADRLPARLTRVFLRLLRG
jgi:trk/ktr system potassium uptake protein